MSTDGDADHVQWDNGRDAGGTSATRPFFVLSGTSAQQITVNSIPRLTVLQPDNRGDEATDFATLFRAFNINTPSQTPNPWDFSQPGDFSVPFTPPEVSSNHGVPTIVNNPTTTIGGAFTGDWMRYDNTTATGGVNAVRDPHFLLSQIAPIDVTKYRNLTIKMLLDRPRDIANAAILRVMWSRNNPLVANAGDTLTVSAIYLDADKNRENGKGTLLATSVPNTGTFTFNAASFPAVTQGRYYVLLEFTDGHNNSYRYASGLLDSVGPAHQLGVCIPHGDSRSLQRTVGRGAKCAGAKGDDHLSRNRGGQCPACLPRGAARCGRNGGPTGDGDATD